MSFENFDRWKSSACYNLPLLRSVPLTTRYPLQAFLHPIDHRNRVSLWVLAAGMLDMSRYLNLTPLDDDLHAGFDGNFRERSVWAEIACYVMLHHDAELREFRVRMKAETDNFADVRDIKLALYDVVMALPNGAPINPVQLLNEVTQKHLAKKRAVVA